ncbi:hypothetical protein F5Y18DRAFT_178961 [Xylariaceae sp. FL1019]|nr:hypothetical protein F5Y18DRAFT_178961 [Xylariaceae sp. FL1019]
MKVLAIVSMASALAQAAVMAKLPGGTSIRDSLPSNYTIGDITWTLPIVEGGEDYTFTGTVQEVFAKVNIERKKKGIAPLDDPNANNGTVAARSLEERDWTQTICNVGLPGPASVDRINQGISYLNKLKGKCTNGPGPGNCGRISCSYNAAIFWCNDQPNDATYDCNIFGAYADDTVTFCSYTDAGANYVTWGQSFDSQHFNVLVGDDAC